MCSYLLFTGRDGDSTIPSRPDPSFLRSHLYVLREKGDCKQITRNSPPYHAHQNSVQFRRNSEFYYFPLTVLESDLNPVLYKEDSYHNEGDKGSTALSIFSKLLRRTLICGSGSRLSEWVPEWVNEWVREVVCIYGRKVFPLWLFCKIVLTARSRFHFCRIGKMDCWRQWRRRLGLLWRVPL